MKFTVRFLKNLTTNKEVKIVGITGAFGSGKSTAASYLKDKGFESISLVSFLEEEAKKRGVRKITRRILQDIGNQWREEFGSDILAKKALKIIKDKKIKLAVVDGFRNPQEILEFRKSKNFTLLGIVTDRKIRFDRLKKLKRREDLTWELFDKLDKRDLGLGQKDHGLHVAQCLAMSDAFIENNEDLDKFKEKIDNFLKTYGK